MSFEEKLKEKIECYLKFYSETHPPKLCDIHSCAEHFAEWGESRAKQELGWQPINTAPKDKWILARRKSGDVHLVHWCEITHGGIAKVWRSDKYYFKDDGGEYGKFIAWAPVPEVTK